MTFADTENIFIEQLLPLYDQNEAKSLALLSIRHVCQISRAQFLADKTGLLSSENETALLQVLDQLKTGKPIQYILGQTEFYGLSFVVNPSVLIPRPETEELVDWVITKVNDLKLKVNSILDIGTGSGCIAISLKKYLPDATVVAMDISPEAIATATKNAQLNQTEIQFVQHNIFSAQHSTLNTQYSILISNPPYVTLAEKKHMHQNVVSYEPHAALFVPDHDPLLFYNKIADFALTHLEPDGFLFFEINENLGQEIIRMLAKKGFSTIELRKDMRGKDRMIAAQV